MESFDRPKKGLLFLTLIYAVGNFSSKALSFLLVFFVTFYLTKEEVGRYDLILITVNLLIPILSLQISDGSFRWLLTKSDLLSRRKIISSTLLFLLAIVALLLILATGIMLFSSGEAVIYLCIVLVLILQTVYVNLQQIVRGLGLNKLYAFNGVLNSMIMVFSAVFFLTKTEYGVLGLLFSIIIAHALTLLQLVITAKIGVYIRVSSFDKELLRSMFKYSVPMVPNALSWWGISSANRYLILLFLGASSNGVFSIALKIPTILTMLINIFTLAWQEKSIETFDDRDRNNYYSNVYEQYIGILFSFAAIVLCFNNIIFTYFVEESFHEAKYLTPILMLATVFSSLASFYAAGFLGAKKTNDLFRSTIIGGAVTIAVSFVLIPSFGLYGAAIAIFVGYLCLFIVRRNQSQHIFQISVSYLYYVRYISLFMIASIPTYVDNLVLECVVAICIVIISIYYQRSIIKNLLNKLWKR